MKENHVHRTGTFLFIYLFHKTDESFFGEKRKFTLDSEKSLNMYNTAL